MAKNDMGTESPGKQNGVLFQRLPQEIRDLIYTQLFSSTRFSLGQRSVSRLGRVTIRPAPNGLALLRACRQVKLEIGHTWLRHVLFCFEDTVTLLDKLTALPADTLSEIRHVRITGDGLHFWSSDDAHSYGYPLASVLRLLPGLQLDQLTVLGSGPRYDNYDSLSRLVEDGNGWKTLRYINHSSAMLGFSTHPHWRILRRYWRKPQPKHWQGVMKGRDGAVSNPSVTVYRAKEPGRYGSVLDPRQRTRFEQKPLEDQDSHPGKFPRDPELMDGDEQSKEIMVVVKRGAGVDYEEKKDAPLIPCDMRRDFLGMSWEQIRAKHIDRDDGADDGRPASDSGEQNGSAEVDVYSDVDEYAWTPVNFHPGQ